MTNKRYKFKKLRWFYKRYNNLKSFWAHYSKVSKKKIHKYQFKAQNENLWYKSRQTVKHLLYFDFLYSRRLDILIASFFGGTVLQVRKMILSNEILINGQVIKKVDNFINFGDFIQIQPSAYFTILKYKHFLLRWKKNQYRGYILTINLLGILFNQSLNIGVLSHFKIWQKWVRRQDRWQTRLSKFQKKLVSMKSISALYLTK